MALSLARVASNLSRAVASRTWTASAVVGARGKHTLPDLPYDYNALEPVVSAEIMEIHHAKHHQTYVNNLNALEEQHAEAVGTGDIAKVISLQGGLKFNGGGHINHTIFWTNLAPSSQGGGDEPTGDLLSAINKDFGSLDKFRDDFSAKTVAVQGSGWGWLGFNKAAGRLEIATCANQDPLQPTTGLIPLLGIDVWEHAYYLQYKNVRPDYVKAVWEVVNWNNVAERYSEAQQ
eukprot:m.477438 g.477438  ORF g.477438 m.477438 type:complete len:233 (-) comp20845_c0_seq1:155-853(-)